MWLTDSQQKLLVSELYKTTGSVKAIKQVMKDCGIVEITKETLRQVEELKKRADAERGQKHGLLTAAKHAVGIFFAEGEKLFK